MAEVAAATATVREGHVSVRGHFMWRDRYVVVKSGQVIILRSSRGAVKAKIDLLDPSVRVVFHEDHTQLAIHANSHTTTFNCHSRLERDAWVSALYTAKGNHGGDTECEGSDLVMSSMEEYEKEKPTREIEKATSERDGETPTTTVLDDDADDQCNDTLRAFQDLRSSMMQCQMSLLDSPRDQTDEPPYSPSASQCAHQYGHDEVAVKRRNLNAIVAFIQTLQHGGRAVLLHLDVVHSQCGISLEEIVQAIGERQHERQQNPSFSSSAMGLQKLHVAAFVRYILFHPLYAKRPEVQRSDKIDALIDRYFPHCRLRRFSHDIEQGSSMHAFELDVSWQRKEYSERSTPSSSSSRTPHAIRVAPVSMPKPDAAALKKKRHSFPNILLPLQIGPLATQPGLARVDSSARTRLLPTRSSSDHLSGGKEPISNNDSDLFQDEILPQPLRTVLWRFSCQQLAEQLSIFHQQQLAGLALWEFVHTPRHAARLVTDHFNRLVSYLVWSVLVEDTAKDRADVVECIISIATAASVAPIHNFHLVMACVGCLGDTPLMPSRLPLTWKRVRSKFKTQLVALRTLCDHKGGFETLRRRQSLESSKGSCIPFIGVIGVTLERLRLAPYVDANGALDLDKLDRQYVAVSSMESAMLRAYKIQESEELQQWARDKLSTMDDFATPRLLQLRSQQLLAQETAQQSGSRHSSLYRSRNSPGSVGGADSTSGDGGPPLLPFHDICSILVSTRDESERIKVCVEALLADDRQLTTVFLRKFHQDFRQSACHSVCHIVLASIRSCVDTVKRDLLAQKSFELMQLTGLDENAIQLERGVYSAIHEAVTKPIASWLFAKIKYVFRDEDARVVDRLRDLHAKSDTASAGSTPSLEKHGVSPLELLATLTESLHCLPSDATHATRVLRCQQILSTSTQHPFSVLFILQHSLDVVFLERGLRSSLELLEAAVSGAGKHPTKRSSLAASFVVSTGGESGRSVHLQPPDCSLTGK